MSDLDSIPNDAIVIRSLEDSQRWLRYSLDVLQPRSRAAENRTWRLCVPWRWFTWRRAIREWEAVTARMEAILDANDRWASSTHPTSRLS